MIIEKYTPTQMVEVEILSETVRGDGGFGSTGINSGDSKKRDLGAQEATHNPEAEVSYLGLPTDALVKGGNKTPGGTPTTVGESITPNSGKLLMIYLSMHDCPACLDFTPLLADLYEELNEDTKTFEVVFFSGDKQEEVFKSYYADMPWLAIPHKDGRLKRIVKALKIKGLPRLIVMDAKTQRILNDDAVDVVTEQGPVIIEQWLSQV